MSEGAGQYWSTRYEGDWGAAETVEPNQCHQSGNQQYNGVPFCPESVQEALFNYKIRLVK